MPNDNATLEASNLEAEAAPAKQGFFYGWVMAAIAMTMAMCTMPGQSVGVAAFNSSIRETLGLTASQFSGAYAIGTILASLLLPLTGAAIDRIGLRKTTAVIIPLLCGACWFISYANGLVMLFVAFLLLRLLGQGSLSLCATNTKAMWFNRRLGRVAGLSSTLVTLFMAASPLVLRWSIEAYGWQATYRGLGVGVVLVMAPLLLLFRNRPGDVGQVIDGLEEPKLSEAIDANGVRSVAVDVELAGLTVSQAMRETSYWILIGVNIIWSMVGTSLIFDVQSLGKSMVGADVAETWFGAIPVDAANTCFFVAVGVMTLIGGFLADAYSLPRLLRIAILGMIGGLVLLVVGDGLVLFAAYAIYGMAQGILSAVGATIWPRYFGRAHLGKIRGGAMMSMVAGSSVGPFIMGYSFDKTGSFRLPLMVFVLMTICGFFATWFLKKPLAEQ